MSLDILLLLPYLPPRLFKAQPTIRPTETIPWNLASPCWILCRLLMPIISSRILTQGPVEASVIIIRGLGSYLQSKSQPYVGLCRLLEHLLKWIAASPQRTTEVIDQTTATRVTNWAQGVLKAVKKASNGTADPERDLQFLHLVFLSDQDFKTKLQAAIRVANA